MAEGSPATWPAIFSAIAATGSAAAATFTFLVHRANLREGTSPELILSETRRGPNECGREDLIIPVLRNAGKGSAFHIRLSATQRFFEGPSAVTLPFMLPVVPANDRIDLPLRILLNWNDSPVPDALTSIETRIEIECRDSRNKIHDFFYDLYIVHPTANVPIGLPPFYAAGVYVTNRGHLRRNMLREYIKTQWALLPKHAKTRWMLHKQKRAGRWSRCKQKWAEITDRWRKPPAAPS